MTQYVYQIYEKCFDGDLQPWLVADDRVFTNYKDACEALQERVKEGDRKDSLRIEEIELITEEKQ